MHLQVVIRRVIDHLEDLFTAATAAGKNISNKRLTKQQASRLAAETLVFRSQCDNYYWHQTNKAEMQAQRIHALRTDPAVKVRLCFCKPDDQLHTYEEVMAKLTAIDKDGLDGLQIKDCRAVMKAIRNPLELFDQSQQSYETVIRSWEKLKRMIPKSDPRYLLGWTASG